MKNKVVYFDKSLGISKLVEMDDGIEEDIFKYNPKKEQLEKDLNMLEEVENKSFRDYYLINEIKSTLKELGYYGN